MLFVLSLISFSIGFASLLKYAYTLIWGKSTESWLDQPAEILTSELKTKTLWGRTWFWYPSISYAYTVDNHRYESGFVSYGRCPWLSFGNKNFAFFTSVNLINKYLVGQPTVTYYNPDSPDLSVLEPGSHPENNVFLALFFFCLVIGTVLVIFA